DARGGGRRGVRAPEQAREPAAEQHDPAIRQQVRRGHPLQALHREAQGGQDVGSATFVIDASTKSRNATAQSSARIRRPCQLCSAGGGDAVVMENSYAGSTNVGIANI